MGPSKPKTWGFRVRQGELGTSSIAFTLGMRRISNTNNTAPILRKRRTPGTTAKGGTDVRIFLSPYSRANSPSKTSRCLFSTSRMARAPFFFCRRIRLQSAKCHVRERLVVGHILNGEYMVVSRDLDSRLAEVSIANPRAVVRSPPVDPGLFQETNFCGFAQIVRARLESSHRRRRERSSR